MSKKGIARVSADVGLIMIVYNLKRIPAFNTIQKFKQLLGLIYQSIRLEVKSLVLIFIYFESLELKNDILDLIIAHLQISIKKYIFTKQLSSF